MGGGKGERVSVTVCRLCAVVSVSESCVSVCACWGMCWCVCVGLGWCVCALGLDWVCVWGLGCVCVGWVGLGWVCVGVELGA